MINLRYHIVSITAVFLALGIGIVLGSSFLDAALSRRIEHNVEAAKADRDAARDERDVAQKEASLLEQRDQDLLDQGSDTLLTDRLSGVPVIILTVNGIDSHSLDALRSALKYLGADFEGTMSVTDKLVDEDAADELAEIVGTPGATGPDVHNSLIEAVANELLDHGMGQESEPSPPVVTRGLRDAGFVDYEAGPGGRPDETMLGSAGYRYIVVTGTEVDVPDDQFLLPLVQTMTETGPAPVTVASAATGTDSATREQSRATALSVFRGDDTMGNRISTVDNLEAFEGVAAVVLSLEDFSRDIRGHYGFGDGAESLLPER